MLTIRNWLRSVFRVGQPQRPVSGVPLKLMLFPASSPRPLVPVAVAAVCPPRPMPTLAGSGIQLKLRHLHTGIRTIAPRPRRETHLAKKVLQMRLPISRRHPNPLKNRSLKPHDYEFHMRRRCVTRVLSPRPVRSHPRTPRHLSIGAANVGERSWNAMVA